MYNRYPEETKRNVVAAIRAGITTGEISRKTGNFFAAAASVIANTEGALGVPRKRRGEPR